MSSEDELGTRLFQMRPGRVRFNEAQIGNLRAPWLIDQAEYESPPAAPPFLLHSGSLEPTLVNRILREGWSWMMMREFAPEVLHWRQPLRHIEFSNFVSVELFETLQSLAPECFAQNWSVTLVGPDGSSMDYVDFALLSIELKDLVLRDQCDPQLEADTPLKAQNISAICYDADRIRDDYVFGPSSNWTVTEAFKQSWANSKISKYMRSTNGEYDYAFTESSGLIRPSDWQLSATPYTWGRAL